jgi:hypothetical protein
MHPVRRAIIFVISAAMIAGGGWLLYEQLTVSLIVWGRLMLASVTLVTVGATWMWHDAIAPLLARKS